jgi:thiamine-phosphate pyrophosphorylase
LSTSRRLAAGLGERRLYLCTPDRSDLCRFVEACITGGVDVVQLRDKHLEARPLVRRARALQRVCAEHQVPFILNDRPDLALEIGADGVHLGQEDAPVSLARRILGTAAIVGVSTHSPNELDASRNEPVDYVSAGPVVETPTKPGRRGTGTEYVSYAAARSVCPVFVTGGVSPETVGDLVRAGARHFVVVRYLTQSTDPLRDASHLRSSIESALAMP